MQCGAGGFRKESESRAEAGFETAKMEKEAAQKASKLEKALHVQLAKDTHADKAPILVVQSCYVGTALSYWQPQVSK
jgi:hypothetical protein